MRNHTSRLKFPKSDPANMSAVQNFYADKTIFITGATGFMGQALLSKLLCSCPDLRRIYILIREKTSKSVDRRMEEIFENHIFNNAKQRSPDYATKIKPIKGDCLLEKLGISDDDKTTLESEVDIILHAAAVVRFDAPLREASHINVRSLDYLLDLAKNMKNLKAFTYVSTAFSACAERKLIEERFYDPPMKAGTLLTLVDRLDDQKLDSIAPALIQPHPNTYIFTKSIAEDLCHDKGCGLPLSIFRPSIVIPCYQEPVPGWTNNTYGPVGVITGYAKGILKVVRVDGNCNADMVPCDYAINALLAVTYHTSRHWEKCTSNGLTFKIPIYNFSNSTTNFKITWRQFFDQCNVALEKLPFYEIASPPSLMLVKNHIIFQILISALHKFPAFIVDMILSMLHKPPKYVRLYNRIHHVLNLIAKFNTKEWTIPNNNIHQVQLSLSEMDKRIFPFNLDTLNSHRYYENFIRGLRSYIANEDENTVKKAIIRHRMYVSTPPVTSSNKPQVHAINLLPSDEVQGSTSQRRNDAERKKVLFPSCTNQ